MQMLLPDARFRSPTAVQGQSDIRDETVYSAIVVQSTGTGQQICFTVPKGQQIPKMNGTLTASTAAHHQNYSDLTTNLTKAGEFGAQLGDGSIRQISITLEQAAVTRTTGAIRSTFGMSQFEVADFQSKASFELKIGGKRQIIGPAHTYPSASAVMGSISTTGNAATADMAYLGGAPRRLKVPVPVARNDVLEGVLAVATGASFAFSNNAGEGGPSLVWFILHTTVKGDVR